MRSWICAVALMAVALNAQTREPTSVETATHRFEEVAPDVYFAVGTGSLFVQSNSLVIVNDADTIIVDSHVTPVAARALLASVAELTDKPVRYLVNTHFHFDHAHGNLSFPPGVAIVGHEYTREKLLGPVLDERTYRIFTGAIPEAVAGMRAAAQAEGDPEKRAQLEAQIRVQQAHLLALEEVEPVPPDVTLARKLVIHREERAIELHFLGRGHTGGDVVVYLPRERLVFTGDLLLPFPSYTGDGYVDEWAETLERLKELDFDLLLPGHGEATRDRTVIDMAQTSLRKLWTEVSSSRDSGLSADQAAARLDLAAVFEAYPLNPLAEAPADLVRNITLLTVLRVYALLAERDASSSD